MLDQLNGFLRSLILEEVIDSEDEPAFSEAAKAWLAEKGEVITVSGNELRFEVPLTVEDWAKEKAAFLSLEGTSVQVSYDGHIMTLVYGERNSPQVEVCDQSESGSYVPNALASLDELPELKSIDEVEAARVAFFPKKEKRRLNTPNRR